VPAAPLTACSDASADRQAALDAHLARLTRCRRCPLMHPPVITPLPVVGCVYLVGQAPGPHEGALGKPFAWTAGRTLFGWFASIGVDEERFRTRAYIAAVCRCFPGKTRQGGDRVPNRDEIQSCSGWMADELALLQPRLVIPVGRLAIEQFLPAAPLEAIIGRLHRGIAFGAALDCLPLPHPSGASTWWRRPPGARLLAEALACLAQQPSWQELQG